MLTSKKLLINKVSDSQRRWLNVIIFGVNKQPVEMDKNTRSEEDASTVFVIITLIKAKPVISHTDRLGRYSNSVTVWQLQIPGCINSNGIVLTKADDIVNAFASFFENSYISSDPEVFNRLESNFFHYSGA